MRCAAQCVASLTSEDWLRAFRYEENWADGVAMAKYDNGGGDHVFVFFTLDGETLIKGFDHESGVSSHAREPYGIWPGIYDGLPSELITLVRDDAVEFEDVTFCFWNLDGKIWKSGTALIPEHIDDGSDRRLRMIQMDADAFIRWAKNYYEDFAQLGEDGVYKVFTEVIGQV